MPVKEEIKLSKIEFAKLEKTRKSLIIQQFGKKPIVVTDAIYWEELRCVGFNPDLGQLEAVVDVKQETGYSGGLCSDGSMEYVRFFIDWGDGKGFQNVGLTSFKAHDIPDTPGGAQHPLKYMVYLALVDQSYQKYCGNPVLPTVRATLSWNVVPPETPEYLPYFGNVLDAQIQIHPAFTTIGILMDQGIIAKDSPIFKQLDINSALPQAKSKVVPWTELAKGYKSAGVPDHRLLYNVVYPMLTGGKYMAAASAQKDISLIEKLKVDITGMIDILLEKKADVTFEEVICAGLNTATDTLGAVIRVKKPSGYSGNLCQPGSVEYVAFWADWNNDGSFESYLGTAVVEVHDIATIPAEGLYYSVMLPVNCSPHLKDCTSPNIVKIRAVLSWAVPSSTVDPNDLKYWGNSLDVAVQIRTGSATTELMDLIYDIGNIAIDNISQVTYLACPSTGGLNPNAGNQPATDRPFGGWVRIGGRIYNSGAAETVHYQVQYRPHGTGDWVPVTNSVTFELMHPDPNDSKYPKEYVTKPGVNGWIPYEEDWTVSPPILERTSFLAGWSTGLLEGVYDIRLAYTKDYPITPSSIIHYSQVVSIILDNTNYTVSPTPNKNVDTAYNLDLVIDVGDCHSYPQGDIIQGHLRAKDAHFWQWVLELQPTTHFTGAPVDPPCRSYGSLVDDGDDNALWTLNTKNLDPCGYTLTLWAKDRTIVDSNGAVVHWNKKAVGFAVQPPP